MTDIIVGIDLGTTNSAVAVVADGQPRILARGDEKIIPSVVGYAAQGGWLVGRPALNQYTLDPTNTIRSIKRKIGTDETVHLGGREFTPQQVSAFILRELKAIAEEALGQPINKAVITVPAYFTNIQRQATKEAGEIAGLEVVRIINEPTAAALAYGLQNSDDQLALVYDLGGGTFDVSLVEMMDGVVEVRASHGDTQLGGDDFDEVLSQNLAETFAETHGVSPQDDRRAVARLQRSAETSKVQLSDFPQVDVREEYLLEQDGLPLHLETTVARSHFEGLANDLLQRTTESMDKVLEDGEVEDGELDRLILVGGSTRMPMVWDLVNEYTSLEPDSSINPDEVVALGAAVQAAIIAGQPVDSILVDVTPYSLGIETATIIGGQLVPDIYSVLIRRNTTIPTTKEEEFSTVTPDQDQVQIKVYQGEAPIASSNTLLGELMISDLKPANPGEHASVNVRFDFDLNGMLKVQASDPVSGAKKVISVQATHAALSPDEIASAREELTEFEEFLEPEDDGIIEGVAVESDSPATIDEETKALFTRAQKLLDGGQLADKQAEQLKTLIAQIKQAESQDHLDELSEELLDVLFDLE